MRMGGIVGRIDSGSRPVRGRLPVQSQRVLWQPMRAVARLWHRLIDVPAWMQDPVGRHPRHLELIDKARRAGTFKRDD
jgi:hypothetical protein